MTPDHTHPELETRLDTIQASLDALTKAVLDQGFALRDMLAILRRVEEHLRRPGQNGSQP